MILMLNTNLFNPGDLYCIQLFVMHFFLHGHVILKGVIFNSFIIYF